ncbi:Osmotin, thaumatin-like protein [Cryphonectria parasitica EP155]|uniref:Osmotin, thaumatin-like protein n=1 Tax=Cryphonectria parasitica (strain ATCC 38755 / EP155) TaxID=660469 RepID=A0A9P5CPG8_CRYP1|nr:Osmotin, thaumatin-like protein [Cryphonectria parasitica EP155]KAF3764990.1 Osmotin, thaumatin-like protein [Cryphonectria parasitica EP155]
MSLWNGKVPLQIYNKCPDTLWPAIYTASGTGPDTGGFELTAGSNQSLEVSSNWDGRVWARTNCTSSGDGLLDCQTGSCQGQMNCTYLSGSPPATLAEFTLSGGVSSSQNFIDISLVDGYNIPLGLEYIADPTSNTTAPPPNLVSPACIATKGYLSAPNRTGTDYTNSTYPMPYEKSQTDSHVGHWCPWPLQVDPPAKPGAGVYPYPDDNIVRPVFDPCLSACQKTGDAKDCCTGSYDSSSKCPRSLYSRSAKAVCPDAYSYPYDDGTSTFVIPGGGGWSVTFCPEGRSTDILATFGTLISEWAASGVMSEDILAAASNVTYIETHGGAVGSRGRPGVGKVLVAALAVSLAMMSSSW